MTLRDLLQTKGVEVHAIRPDATLQDAVQEMVRHNIGSLLVRADDAQAEPMLLGIITERDILRAQAAHQVPLERLRVESVMSIHLVTASPDHRVTDAMGLMTHHRVRHLPVVAAGRLFGIISIGDLVKSQFDETVLENHYMKSYIQGEGAEIGTVPSPREMQT